MLRLSAPGALTGVKELLRREHPSSVSDDLAEMNVLSADYFASEEGRQDIRVFAEKGPSSWVAQVERSGMTAHAPVQHNPRSGERRPDVAGWAPHVVTRPPLRVAIVCAPLTRYALRHLLSRDKRPHS
jgi:hypothetical protein